MSDMTTATPTTTPPADRPRPARRGLLFPLVLIAIGGLLFAGNLGYVPAISARALFQLWPVLLVLGGIELALARREPYLALGLEVLVIAAAIALAVSQPRGFFLQPSSGSTVASIQRSGATALSLRVDGGAGRYTVHGGAAALVDARSEGGEITVADTRRGADADVRVQPVGFGETAIFGGQSVPQDVDVRVASDVPTSLRVQGGAGEFTVDMRDMRIRDARIETGASKVEVMLPRPSGDVALRIQAGAASISITVPDDVEARVTTSGGLLSMSVANSRLSGGGAAGVAVSRQSAETPGYAAAKDRVTITVEAGASSITIR